MKANVTISPEMIAFYAPGKKLFAVEEQSADSEEMIYRGLCAGNDQHEVYDELAQEEFDKSPGDWENIEGWKEDYPFENFYMQEIGTIAG